MFIFRHFIDIRLPSSHDQLVWEVRLQIVVETILKTSFDMYRNMIFMTLDIMVYACWFSL